MTDREIISDKALISCPCEIVQVFSNACKILVRKTPKPIMNLIYDHPYLVGAITATSVIVFNSITSIFVWRIRRRKRRQKYKRGVVILHQFQRGRFAPSFSAFPLKLETYLRMVNLPYESCFEEPLGASGICPWITFNGDDIYGAQSCIEYLNDKLNIDLNKGMTDYETSVALSYRILIEDHLYWCLALYQWRFDSSRQIHNAVHSNFVFRHFVRPLVSRMINQAAFHHGIGRHSQQEILEMGLQDLQALSYFLECKPFFMGSEPNEIDATLFACLAIIVYNLPFSPYAKFMNGECKNLRDYVRRMKDRYWPDWDYCLSSPPNLCSIDYSTISKSGTVRRF